MAFYNHSSESPQPLYPKEMVTVLIVFSRNHCRSTIFLQVWVLMRVIKRRCLINNYLDLLYSYHRIQHSPPRHSHGCPCSHIVLFLQTSCCIHLSSQSPWNYFTWLFYIHHFKYAKSYDPEKSNATWQSVSAVFSVILPLHLQGGQAEIIVEIV